MDNYTPRLKELYTESIVPKLKEKLSRQNTLSLPKLYITGWNSPNVVIEY